MSMSDSNPRFGRLLRSLLIPVDKDELVKFLSKMRGKIDKTAWHPLSNRLDSISVLMIIVGGLTFSVHHVLSKDINPDFVYAIGLHYILGFTIVGVLTLSSIILGLLENINHGSSIFPVTPERPILMLLMKISFSVLAIFIAFYIFSRLNIQLGQLVLVFILSCVLLGAVIAVISGLLSFLLLIRSYIA